MPKYYLPFDVFSTIKQCKNHSYPQAIQKQLISPPTAGHSLSVLASPGCPPNSRRLGWVFEAWSGIKGISGTSRVANAARNRLLGIRGGVKSSLISFSGFPDPKLRSWHCGPLCHFQWLLPPLRVPGLWSFWQGCAFPMLSLCWGVDLCHVALSLPPYPGWAGKLRLLPCCLLLWFALGLLQLPLVG